MLPHFLSLPEKGCLKQHRPQQTGIRLAHLTLCSRNPIFFSSVRRVPLGNLDAVALEYPPHLYLG